MSAFESPLAALPAPPPPAPPPGPARAPPWLAAVEQQVDCAAVRSAAAGRGGAAPFETRAASMKKGAGRHERASAAQTAAFPGRGAGGKGNARAPETFS